MEPSRRCWNGTTSGLQPEEITSMGIEFYVCTINKSAHTKKVWKLIFIACFEPLIQVRSGEHGFHLRWKFSGLAWKRVRSVLEILILFNLCSCVNNLGTHLAASLLILEISVKTVWSEQQPKPMNLAGQ